MVTSAMIQPMLERRGSYDHKPLILRYDLKLISIAACVLSLSRTSQAPLNVSKVCHCTPLPKHYTRVAM